MSERNGTVTPSNPGTKPIVIGEGATAASPPAAEPDAPAAVPTPPAAAGRPRRALSRPPP